MFDFKVLAIVPCLDEAAHIGDIVRQLLSETADLDLRIAVVDGGSTDGTVDIVSKLAEVHPEMALLNNPKRIQSAGVNLAATSMGHDVKYIVRLDAHAKYSAHYCRELAAEAERMSADAVAVSMISEGHTIFEKIVAAAQNSLIGNGGSAHRNDTEGRWIDHGHHALMRMSAFAAVGGYDEAFTHNEDAELDFRLTRAGFKIWLTGRARMMYFPRSTVASLFRQYVDYGRGRARNWLKNLMAPKIRQLIPAPIVPLVVLSLVPGLGWLKAAIFLWGAACVLYGLNIALRTRSLWNVFSGPCAMIMHFAWSLGFWIELGTQLSRRIWQRMLSLGQKPTTRST